MKSEVGQRWAAILVQSAPVWLGAPLWAIFGAQDLNFFFVPGLFMLVGGLAAAGIARLSARGFVRAQAAQALRFQGWILSAVPLWALGFGIATLFDPPNPTMDHPPIFLEAAVGIGAFAFGLILPIVELIRVGVGVAAAWKGPPAKGIEMSRDGIP